MISKKNEEEKQRQKLKKKGNTRTADIKKKQTLSFASLYRFIQCVVG
jgi:hypothetical protein